jgi:hypothetical protein
LNLGFGWEINRKEATRGFEPLIRVLQTLALPLGHVAVKKGLLALVVISIACSLDVPERAMGLGPTTSSLARRRSTN